MRARAARIPLGMTQPADIAGAIAYFVRPDSSHVTGQTLLVDGGTQLI
jgi:NAD(P)-dependent dehydrogenase (short-subunit alcohol dehydrogenase family)